MIHEQLFLLVHVNQQKDIEKNEKKKGIDIKIVNFYFGNYILCYMAKQKGKGRVKLKEDC